MPQFLLKLQAMTETEEVKALVEQVNRRARFSQALYDMESASVRLGILLEKADSEQAEKVFAAMDTILNLVRDKTGRIID